MSISNKIVIFRADGNSTTGLGHLYRLFALVEMLKNDFEIVFVTSENSTQSVIPANYNVKNIPAQITTLNEPAWLNECFDAKKAIVIADGYGFDSAYQKDLVDFGFKLIYIDDLFKSYMHADIVVNHAEGILEQNYNARSDTKFALGTKYAILRPAFLNAINNIRIVEKIEAVFVCFGGADALNLTELTVETLLQFHDIKKVNVVLGGAYVTKPNSLFKTANNRLNVHRNLNAKELVEVMLQCQLAIVPASTILYEVCAVKIPTLAGFYVDNQKGIYDGFLHQGAISGLGNFNTLQKNELKSQISKMLQKDVQQLNSQIEKQSLLFDHEIVERYKRLIQSIC